MKNYLFNPFKYVAGTKALFIGLAVICLSAIIGYFTTTHFPGIIDVKSGPELPFYAFFVEGIQNWLLLSFFLLTAALFIAKTNFRVIDIFGTQALARAPFLLVAYINKLGPLSRFGQYVQYNFMGQGEEVVLAPWEPAVVVLIMLFVLAVIIWAVALMFNAYKVSTNLKNPKLTASFIVSIVLAEIASQVLLTQYLKFIL